MSSIIDLKQIWLNSLLNIDYSNQLKLHLYEEILSFYNSEGRHYHNAMHLKNMFENILNYIDHLTNFDHVVLATWFHDVIYEPFSNKNEENSALFAEKKLKCISYPNNVISKIKDYILRTKNHFKRDSSDEFDLHFFIDCDLATLGSERSLYVEYTKKIRMEYQQVPDDIFINKRLQLLTKFLSTNKIYHTDIFYEKYEVRARENIIYEQQELRKLL